MFLLNFVSVFAFGVDAHIMFTECQAEYYRSQPGNEDVDFETDGRPCPKKRKRRGLMSENFWDDNLQAQFHANLSYGFTGTQRWNNFLHNGKHIVPYFFEDGYENHQYDLFKEHTCVEFKRLRTEEEKNQYEYIIMIVHDENNEGTCEAWSNLGRLPLEYQPQKLNMCPGAWAWYHNTTMQHEAMHALGFHHEQNRPDRDEYVEIHPNVTGYSQYVKLTPDNWVNTTSPYDFDSIMHYPAYLIGSGEYEMSVPGSNYQTPITANSVYPFSEEDIKQINYAYCSGKELNFFTYDINIIFWTFKRINMGWNYHVNDNHNDNDCHNNDHSHDNNNDDKNNNHCVIFCWN